MALGHAAHQVAIADLVQERIGIGVRYVVFANVRRLPDLQGVVLLGFVMRLEADHLAAMEKGGTVAQDGRFDSLLDQVVPQQHVIAARAIVEEV